MNDVRETLENKTNKTPFFIYIVYSSIGSLTFSGNVKAALDFLKARRNRLLFAMMSFVV